MLSKVPLNQETLELKISGKNTLVRIPEGMNPAHGVGLDDKTKVHSLLFGESPEYPGMLFVQDTHGNNSITTAHELFVITKKAAPGYTITATKMSFWRKWMRAITRVI